MGSTRSRVHSQGERSDAGNRRWHGRNTRPARHSQAKLLALDLVLIENRRPRAMFLSLLVGGLTVALTIGLLDVLVLHADAINHQASISAGVDLALGLFLLAAGALLATGRLHGRPKAQVPAGDRQPEKPEQKSSGADRGGCSAVVHPGVRGGSL